jgi:uncharacterized protein (TIGR03086 family)
MTPELDGSVELLDRALGYTRVALAGITPDALDRPTPCAGWRLRDLLAHMADALEAFTEAAAGAVEVRPVAATGFPAVDLRERACALLAAWSRPVPGDVRVGGLDLGSRLLVGTAALEVTVHGWDVGRATGRGAPIPRELARDLLPLAERVVDPADRGIRFAAARPVPQGAAYDVRLLAFLGRDLTGPPAG